jgi:hypothetical protein
MLDTKKVQNRLQDLLLSLQAYHALTQKDRAKLTKQDKRRIPELEVELNAILEPAARSELIVDVHMVARFFGVSLRLIQVWVAQKGCPKLKHGHYDLLAVFGWWSENINSGTSEAEENVRLEYWRWKTLNEKYKAEQTSGELLSRDEVLTAWANRIRSVWDMLYLLESRLPPVLHGKSIGEMQEVIRVEIRAVNEYYCRHGKHAGKPVDGEPTIVKRKRGRPKKNS